MMDYPRMREILEQLGFPEHDQQYEYMFDFACKFYMLAINDFFKSARDILGENVSDASKKYIDSIEYFNAKERIDQRLDFMAGATWMIEQLEKNM